MYQLGERSLKKLCTCHEDIKMIINEAIKNSPYDFAITHGHRTPEEQHELYKKGRDSSGNIVNFKEIVTYMDGYIKKSKHNYLPSLACDIAIFVHGKLTWEKQFYIIVAEHIIEISEQLFKTNQVLNQLVWGGNWERFKDLPHFQI